MNVLAVFGVAFRSLQRAPVRSTLTALGVIVGVAAVVATTSIGNGAKAKLEETLTRPESRIVYLAATVPRAQLRRPGFKLPPSDFLKPADYYALRESVSHVTAINPRIFLPTVHASANGRGAEIALEGLDLDGFVTAPRRLLEGDLFSSLDVQHAANVCVISRSLAQTFFPESSAQGRLVRINDTTFRIIGVVEDIEVLSPSAFEPPDLRVYIPFTSLLRRVDPNASISIAAQSQDLEHVNRVQRDISDLIEVRRSGRKAEFRTNTAFEFLKTYADGSLTVARLLAAVGTISLIVGGIGIMNIMLASVSERTREIGVRMAVGTRSRHILAQFLAEATALSLMGGGIGVAVGALSSIVITRMNEWPTSITLDSVLTAVVCSVAVGIFFGYHPARRAALMRPVDALRTEH